MMHRHWRRLLITALVTASAVNGAVAQQQAPEARSAVASPQLDASHWAVEAVQRLEALGLGPGSLARQGPRSRGAVADVLAHGARAAAEQGHPIAELAGNWWARFQAEFREYDEPAGGQAPPRLLGGHAEVGYRAASGRHAPGLGEFPPGRTGALPLPEQRGGWLGVHLAAAPLPGVAVDALPVLDAEGVGLARWEVSAAWRNWMVGVGRAPVGYSVAEGGGVVLSAQPALDRVQLASATPFRLPGWLGVLGAADFSTLFALLSEERHPGRPLFWGASASLSPHPRLTLSVHRGALVGGDSVSVPITPGRVASLLIGKHASVENQIVSGGLRFRLPTEALLPVTAHCEWGAEDSSGALSRVPGVICGVLLPALPGVPQAALGAEYAHFGASCCGNPPWYRHQQFPGSWALESGPLGHPLGGQGTERLVFGRASALDARLEVEGRAFWRERAGENLFVPGREGASVGWGGSAAWRALGRATLEVAGGREAGADWSEPWVTVQSKLRF